MNATSGFLTALECTKFDFGRGRKREDGRKGVGICQGKGEEGKGRKERRGTEGREEKYEHPLRQFLPPLPFILGKVSRSEKSNRRLRKMESYKQKENAVNLLHSRIMNE